MYCPNAGKKNLPSTRSKKADWFPATYIHESHYLFFAVNKRTTSMELFFSGGKFDDLVKSQRAKTGSKILPVAIGATNR